MTQNANILIKLTIFDWLRLRNLLLHFHNILILKFEVFQTMKGPLTVIGSFALIRISI